MELRTDRLYQRYDAAKFPTLDKYSKQCRYSSKLSLRQYNKWFDAMYPHTYKDVKEGDYFILHNGGGSPVAFVQLKGEYPRKDNAPTRLWNGSYFPLSPDMRVAIVSEEEAMKAAKETRSVFH